MAKTPQGPWGYSHRGRGSTIQPGKTPPSLKKEMLGSGVMGGRVHFPVHATSQVTWGAAFHLPLPLLMPLPQISFFWFNPLGGVCLQPSMKATELPNYPLFWGRGHRLPISSIGGHVESESSMPPLHLSAGVKKNIKNNTRKQVYKLRHIPSFESGNAAAAG